MLSWHCSCLRPGECGLPFLCKVPNSEGDNAHKLHLPRCYPCCVPARASIMITRHYVSAHYSLRTEGRISACNTRVRVERSCMGCLDVVQPLAKCFICRARCACINILASRMHLLFVYLFVFVSRLHPSPSWSTTR